MTLCDLTCDSLPQYVADGETESLAYASVRAHLRVCATCRAQALALRHVEQGLRNLPLVVHDPLLTARILRRVAAESDTIAEEWRLLPWAVWVPALAVVLAIVFAAASLPMPSSATLVQGLRAMLSGWLPSAPVQVDAVLFWAIWLAVFATSAGVGIGLSLSHWDSSASHSLGKVQSRVSGAAARLWGLARRTH